MPLNFLAQSFKKISGTVPSSNFEIGNFGRLGESFANTKS